LRSCKPRATLNAMLTKTTPFKKLDRKTFIDEKALMAEQRCWSIEGPSFLARTTPRLAAFVGKPMLQARDMSSAESRTLIVRIDFPKRGCPPTYFRPSGASNRGMTAEDTKAEARAGAAPRGGCRAPPGVSRVSIARRETGARPVIRGGMGLLLLALPKKKETLPRRA